MIERKYLFAPFLQEPFSWQVVNLINFFISSPPLGQCHLLNPCLLNHESHITGQKKKPLLNLQKTHNQLETHFEWKEFPYSFWTGFQWPTTKFLVVSKALSYKFSSGFAKDRDQSLQLIVRNIEELRTIKVAYLGRDLTS